MLSVSLRAQDMILTINLINEIVHVSKLEHITHCLRPLKLKDWPQNQKNLHQMPLVFNY